MRPFRLLAESPTLAGDAFALVFKLQPLNWEEWSRETAPPTPGFAIGELLTYLDQRLDGARLSPLYTELPTRRLGPNAVLAIPRPGDLRWPTGVNIVQFDSEADAGHWADRLGSDRAVAYVHRPVGFTPTPVVKSTLELLEETSGLVQCGFPLVWKAMDAERDDPIAIIDNGNDGLAHPELARRIEYTGSVSGYDSRNPHAAAVAAIISARRSDGSYYGYRELDGCCSANVRVYNCWEQQSGRTRFDYMAFHRALQDVARRALKVVNMSFTFPLMDRTTEVALTTCIDAGVVAVAAVGSYGRNRPPRYPAGHDRVVGVAACTPHNTPVKNSSTGDHVFLAAPGTSVYTIAGNRDYERLTGSSFAAAYVTAAVWLARSFTRLTVDDMRDLLATTAVGPGGGRTDSIGHGRIDVAQLARALGAIP